MPRSQKSQKPAETKPVETLIVVFDSDAHRELHQVLMNYGFTFKVGSDLHISHFYEHPTKPVIVELKDVFEDLEAICIDPRTDRVYGLESYSKVENDWMNECKTESESLERELYILINVRPNALSSLLATSRQQTPC